MPHVKIHKRLIWITGIAMFLAAVGTWADYYYHAGGPLQEPTVVLFKKGTGFRQIVDDLEKNGVIRHGWLFKAVAVTLGDARKFKAGEYKFTAAISPRLVMDMIAEGRVVVRRLIVPEGFKVSDVIAMLENEPALEGKVVDVPKEGSLLPETYHFTYGDSRAELMERMRTGMLAVVAEVWAKRKEGGIIKTPEEAVTLASIVERETDVASERGRISAVFINRMKKGMKLQSDPTVIYAVEKEQGGPLKRPLTNKDLAIDSPYNTYKVEGLPPGPISNPGRAAIEAVLNPPETKEMYFVATGRGGHNFSETLTGHNTNVGQYRKELRIQRGEKPEEPKKKEESKKPEPKKAEPKKKPATPKKK